MSQFFFLTFVKWIIINFDVRNSTSKKKKRFFLICFLSLKTKIFFNLHNRYAEENPGQRVPGPITFRRLRDRLQRWGTLLPHQRNAGRPRTRIAEQLRQDILRAFDEDPNLSTRLCAVRFNINHQDVWKILNDAGRKPYKFQPVQHLLGFQDFVRRNRFAEDFLNSQRILAPRFHLPSLILWTDECNFTPDGMYNHKNYVTWADTNPHLVVQRRTQFRWTINVWAGIIGNIIVSLKVYEEL